MTFLELFAGVGVGSFAAKNLGFDVVGYCEIDKLCRQVLAYYHPQATAYEDINTTDFTAIRNTVSVILGGFPCQPYSNAGKQLGLADTRALGPRMLEVIRQVSPKWVISENVRGFVTMEGGGGV